MTPRTISASLLLALSLVACGQSVATPDTTKPVTKPAASPDTTAACVALYESYAGWIEGCTGSQLAHDEIDHFAVSCAERAALPGVDATPAAINSCGARIAASSCAALPADCIMSNYLGYAPPANRDFLVNEDEVGYQLFPAAPGKLAAGQACDLAIQCQSGACSTTFSYDFDHTCGICVTSKRIGEACDATTFCEYRSGCIDGVCKDAGDPLGSACQSAKGDSNCTRDLYCPGGTCVPRLQVGNDCTGSYEQTQGCARGLVCNESICKQVVEGHVGDACDEVVVKCGAGTFCADGHCRAPVANVGLGGACVGDACAPGLRCNGTVCAAPAQAGEHCYEDRQCGPGLTCPAMLQQDPRCAPPSQEGEACIASDACDNGLFCDGANPSLPVCHRLRAAGEACDDSDRCWAPLSCIDGFCGEIGTCSAP